MAMPQSPTPPFKLILVEVPLIGAETVKRILWKPSRLRDLLDAPHLHWRLRIIPQVAARAGFELGAGLPINTSAPEREATMLQSIAAAECAKEMDA